MDSRTASAAEWESENNDVGGDRVWLAAEDMARLRVSQRRWADGVEQQRLRVRLAVPSAACSMKLVCTGCTQVLGGLAAHTTVSSPCPLSNAAQTAVPVAKRLSAHVNAVGQDGLVKTGGWGVSIGDLQQLHDDARREAQAAPAGDAVSLAGPASPSPASSSDPTASPSRSQGGGRGRSSPARHLTGSTGWGHQQGRGKTHGQPSDRSWRPRQAQARERANGRGDAAQQVDVAAREERTRRSKRTSNAGQMKQHIRVDVSDAKPV